MKNYLNYLKSKPLIIIWFLFITLVIVGCLSQIFIYWDDNGPVLNIAVLLLLTVIYGISTYQPYYEWKSGLKEDERKKNNSKTL